jgi:uncharacterized protein YjbI with pentapeptide repeats
LQEPFRTRLLEELIAMTRETIQLVPPVLEQSNLEQPDLEQSDLEQSDLEQSDLEQSDLEASR